MNKPLGSTGLDFLVSKVQGSNHTIVSVDGFGNCVWREGLVKSGTVVVSSERSKGKYINFGGGE